jgi:hypothetical protein
MKEYTEENAREEVRDYHAFLDEKDRQVERLTRKKEVHGMYYVIEKEPLAGFLPKKIPVYYHVDSHGLMWVRTEKGEWKLKNQLSHEYTADS